ncbi:MAG: MarR family transcriptional regulator [Streptosporangiales bacterium]|nr:MarR family transcriptional regulator [Streptosporangiales bacterium]
MTEEQLADHRLTAVGLVIEVRSSLRARTGTLFADQLDGMPDFDALIRLARSPGRRLRMGDLAAQMSLSTGGATRLVDRLELRRLVCRESYLGDRRGSYAVLTDAGAEQLAAVLPILVEAIDRWFISLLPPADLDAALQALRAVRDTVRPGAAAGSSG